MSNAKRYIQPSDVTMRLAHSYARYRGEPCYIDVASGFRIGIYTNPKGNMTLIDANDPDLDISSPPTGYIFERSHGVAIWVGRMPLRQQKQGLENHCVKSLIEYENFVVKTNGGLPGMESTFNMMKGLYPSPNECIEKIRGGKFQSVPFSNQFCLVRLTDAHKTFGLKFMAQPIGLVDSESSTAIIRPCYSKSPVANSLAKYFNVEVQEDAS